MDEIIRLKKEKKRLYDIEYRKKNKIWLKLKKHVYFTQTYNPVEAKKARKFRSSSHSEYCRRPEYKLWKRKYDAERRAKEYGHFGECYKLLLIVEKEILSHMSRYEIGLANCTINKRLKRKREHETFVSSRP